MTRADMDRANKKPGELKKELAEMVGRVADEQTRCRIEGFKMALRELERLCMCGEVDELNRRGRKRWGSAFDA